ncbi:hypothetical protein CHS0354_012760 [Potamilus streckersoni]|uniref:Uncharacterized protein n=1 Tax=Potamilus streckersoni TaxID=2493646 RepID=A0AAE0VKI6_9BIVA|nr:hypothetical protein CHS0354_012760 [Potamilus streckersoni]
MKILAFNLFHLIFLFAMNELSFAEVDEWTMNILLKMKSWGEKVKDNYLPNSVRRNNQFIAVAILSNTILNDKDKFNSDSLDTGCPENVIEINTYQCRTSAVIFNENLKIHDPRLEKIHSSNDFQNRMRTSGNKANKNTRSGWHGEIILIHGGILETLKTNFWNDEGGTEGIHCEIYLYSYYIPCAKVRNTPYSCSQEIMFYNIGTQNDPRQCKITVVGYTKIFNKFNVSTDEDQAKGWLHEGLTELILIENNIGTIYVPTGNNGHAKGKDMEKKRMRQKRLASSESYKNTDDMVFQDLVYKCLDNTPLPFCCLSRTTDNMRRQKLLSFFVNKISHYCTHNSTEMGPISSHSLYHLKRCFSSWLQDNVGSDCRICSDGSLQSAWYQQYLVAFCIDGIMDWATTFGRPSNAWDLTNPVWVPWNGPWKNMYLQSVRSFQSGINLFCENRMLDIGSMCTKMTTKTIKKQSMKNLLIDRFLWP